MNNNIKLVEFDALIKITVEMSRYLYPYTKKILQSKEEPEKDGFIWSDFNMRFVELVNERLNTNSMKVKKLLDPNNNDYFLIKSLLTLGLSISEQGYQKLRNSLLDF